MTTILIGVIEWLLAILLVILIVNICHEAILRNRMNRKFMAKMAKMDEMDKEMEALYDETRRLLREKTKE